MTTTTVKKPTSAANGAQASEPTEVRVRSRESIAAELAGLASEQADTLALLQRWLTLADAAVREAQRDRLAVLSELRDAETHTEAHRNCLRAMLRQSAPRPAIDALTAEYRRGLQTVRLKEGGSSAQRWQLITDVIERLMAAQRELPELPYASDPRAEIDRLRQLLTQQLARLN